MTDWTTVALGMSGISFIGILALAARFGKIELKVDTLWELQLRRGLVEGKLSEVLRQNSPVTVLPKLAERLAVFNDELRQFYEDGGSKMDEITEAMEIERRFGARLIKEVCMPLQIFQGACIVGAMIYGRSLAVKSSKKTVLSSGHHKAVEKECQKGTR